MARFGAFRHIPRRHYNVVCMDPPWKYEGDPNKDQAAGKHYRCLTVSEMIDEFPVRDVLAIDNAVFVWATGPKLHHAIELIDGMDLYYRGVAFVWVKTTKTGKVISGQGVRPSYVKPTTEYLLVASTKKQGRSLKLATEAMPQVFMDEETILAPRPGNIHSKKPSVFYKRIEDLFLPGVRRLEMFAREPRDGWDVFGNEV